MITRGTVVRREISDRYLSEKERVQIADLRAAGAGVRAIAERTGRSPSTISRELRRNRDPGSGQYRPFTAHKLAVQRRPRPCPGKIAADPVLRQFVAGRLEKRWSTQQVSRALPGEFPGERARHVVHETIYQVVYRPELGGLSRELPARVLRTGRRCRPHRRPGLRRSNGIIAMTMIDQRPAEAAGRREPGHWEGDLITGASNRPAIGTLMDRASRYTMLLHLPGRHTAEAVRDALIAAFWYLPPCLHGPAPTRWRPVSARRPARRRPAVPAGRPSLLRHHRSQRTRTCRRPERGVRPAPYALSSVLTCCDMTSSPNGELVPVELRLAEIQDRYGPGHLVSRSIHRATPMILGAVKARASALINEYRLVA